MADLKDILNEPGDPANDDLLNYLQGQLSPDKAYEVEKQMAGSEFVGDAVEGLQAIGNKKSIEVYVDELNQQLHRQLASKKEKKLKRRWKDSFWIIVAVIVVLGLCIIGYTVIRYYQHTEPPGVERKAQ